MRKLCIFFLTFPILAFPVKANLTVCHSTWLDVGRFIGDGTPVDFGFAVFKSTETIQASDDTLILAGKGSSDCTILAIHGLDPFEYQSKDIYFNEFKSSMIEAWKESGSMCSLYIFKYPSLFESYWDSGKKLAKLAANLKNIKIIAHSKGGLVARCALENAKFRRNVKDVYFLGVPHFGSPLADALIVDPHNFEKTFHIDRVTADAMRITLAMSYTIGYISSVGSRELSWMNKRLPPLRNYPSVKYHMIAGMLTPNDIDSSLKAIQISFDKRAVVFSWQLMYMAALSDMIGKGRDEFSPSDGMVPVVSALALGKLKGEKLVIYGYTHATLYKDIQLLREMINGSLKLPMVEAMGFEPTASTLRR